MNRNTWLAIILVVLWMSLASFWYLCGIKDVCNSAGSNISTVDSLEDSNDIEPIMVRWNSSDILFGANYDSAMNALTSNLNANDTILITGYYFEDEQGSDLGYRRAQALKKSLMLFIDSNLIQLEGLLKKDFQPSKDKPFAAFSFRVIPNIPTVVEPMDEPVTEKPVTEKPIAETPPKKSKPAETPKSNVSTNNSTILFEGRTIDQKSSAESSKAINDAVAALKQNKSYRAKVIGYTNISNNSKDDNDLGRKRAWIIKKTMMNMGVDPDRIVTSAKSVSGKAAELQKVEIEILKK